MERGKKDMNVLVYGAPYYEFQLATIVEGLQILGHKVYDIRKEGRNYMEPYNGEFIDLYIDAFPHEKFSPKFNKPLTKIMIWPYDLAEDRSLLNYDEHIFDIAFVRDYDGNGPANVFPMNYGIEYRYFCAGIETNKSLVKREYDITYLAALCVGERREYLRVIEKYFADKNLLIGDKGTLINEADPYWSQWVNGIFTHNNDYYRALANSKIIISTRGGGPECGRIYEAIASHALPLTEYRQTIQVPPVLEEAIPEIFFKGPEEMVEKTNLFLNDLEYAQAVADKVYDFGKNYLVSIELFIY